MAKLYPPYIEGSIPAFYGTASGTTLVVPFAMSRAVAIEEIYSFVVTIKTVQGNTYLGSFESQDWDSALMEVYFKLSESFVKKLTIGSFYKIQLAYRDNQTRTTGYFSTVGVVKYSTEPAVQILGLKTLEANTNLQSFIGEYRQEERVQEAETGKIYNKKDITEKIYSYCFEITDAAGRVIETSGEKLHNAANDTSNTYSTDSFDMAVGLETNKNYYVQYKTTSLNGIKKASPKYKLLVKVTVDAEVDIDILPAVNCDNGYIQLALRGGLDEDNKEKTATGSFLLCRSNSKTNFQQWEEIYRFTLYGALPSDWTWKDFTVEQGVEYIYSLQQYNSSGLYSNRILSEKVYVDFEDMFLFDGERQLKIKFNPKVSSFKTDILESKTDTIGDQYTFIFRNGNVRYKEFPLSGLISYYTDEENLFMSDEDLALSKFQEDRRDDRINLDTYKGRTTDLVDYNVHAERIFKLEVLDWLQNGKEKLFRSPTEGNYIVRLMNVSLSPEDKINRMLHTFSATAYEVAECNYANLSKYCIMTLDTTEVYQTRWGTIAFAPLLIDDTESEEANDIVRHYPLWRKACKTQNLLTSGTAYSLEFNDCMPGQVFYIDDGIIHTYTDEEGTKPLFADRRTGYTIMIGATGTYKMNDVNVKRVWFESSVQQGMIQGQLSYSYRDSVENSNTFAHIVNTSISDCLDGSYVMNQKDLNEGKTTVDVIAAMTDIKKKYMRMYYMRFKKRPIIVLDYVKDLDGDLNNIEIYNPYVLYCIHNYEYGNEDGVQWFDGDLNRITTIEYNEDYEPTNLDYSIIINGSTFELPPSPINKRYEKVYEPSELIGEGTKLVQNYDYVRYTDISMPTFLFYKDENNNFVLYTGNMRPETFAAQQKMADDNPQKLYKFYTIKANYEVDGGSKIITFQAEEELDISQAVDVESLIIGNGIQLECSYQGNEWIYKEEKDDINHHDLVVAKREYDRYCEYIDCIMHGFKTSSTSRSFITDVDRYWVEFHDPTNGYDYSLWGGLQKQYDFSQLVIYYTFESDYEGSHVVINEIDIRPNDPSTIVLNPVIDNYIMVPCSIESEGADPDTGEPVVEVHGGTIPLMVEKGLKEIIFKGKTIPILNADWRLGTKEDYDENYNEQPCVPMELSSVLGYSIIANHLSNSLMYPIYFDYFTNINDFTNFFKNEWDKNYLIYGKCFMVARDDYLLNDEGIPCRQISAVDPETEALVNQLIPLEPQEYLAFLSEKLKYQTQLYEQRLIPHKRELYKIYLAELDKALQEEEV